MSVYGPTTGFKSTVSHPSGGPALLWAVGVNTYGQIGNNTLTSYNSPIQIGTGIGWNKVSSGIIFTLAVGGNGTLWAWGRNLHGQLGNGTVTNYSSPIQIGALTNWAAVSAGHSVNSGLSSSYAIKTDGTLWAWGANNYGQLGNNTTSYYSSPIQIGSLTNWRQVVSSNGFNSTSTLAVKTDNTLWGWGFNLYGEVGNNTTSSYSSPIQIGTDTNWQQITSNFNAALAVKTNGTLWAWGRNLYGVLGNDTTTNYSSPIQIGLLTSWSKVNTSGTSSAAIKTDGTLWTWGRDDDGQIGNGVVLSFGKGYSSPIQIGSLTDWKTAEAGTQMLAVKTDGSLWAWGRDTSNYFVYTSSPVQIGSNYYWEDVSNGGGASSASFFLSDFTQTQDIGDRILSKDYILDVYPNIASQMGARTSPGLWVWGENSFSGRLGNGTSTSYSSPIQIGRQTNWKRVVCGYSTAVALKTDGTLWTWGDNSWGLLGNNTNLSYSSPIQVGLLTNWWTVSSSKVPYVGGGSYYPANSALKTDGTLWTWGNNSYGQLGNNTTTDYSSPIQIGSLTNWRQVEYGNGCAIAVKTDNTLWTWGNNSYGQLGNNTTTDYSSPIQVGTLTNWKQVSMSTHAMAIKTDGTLWAWGYNLLGQLGNDTRTRYSSPIQVGALTNWKQVSCASDDNTVAVKTDGTLWAWGRNGSGQLGINSTSSCSSPTQVGALTNWKFVSGGYSSAVALKTDGTLWAWGNDTGNGTLTSYSSPIQVGKDANWKQVDCNLIVVTVRDGYI